MSSPGFQYQPRPSLANKKIAVFASVYPKAEKHKIALESLVNMVEIVIDEPNCQKLAVTQFVTDPSHFMLYEEWEDYEELFTVQVKRPYRKGFSENMSEVRDKPPTLEVFEIVANNDSAISTQDAREATGVLTRFPVVNTQEEKVKNDLIQFMKQQAGLPDLLFNRLFRTINEPDEFVYFEMWGQQEKASTFELSEDFQEHIETICRDSGAKLVKTDILQVHFTPIKK